MLRFFYLNIPQQELIPGGIITFRPGNIKPVFNTVGKAKAEIISLHFFISITLCGRIFVADPPEQSAFRFSWNDIRIDTIRKLVFV